MTERECSRHPCSARAALGEDLESSKSLELLVPCFEPSEAENKPHAAARYDVRIPQVVRIDPLDEIGKASQRLAGPSETVWHGVQRIALAS